jgi:hypothetical protein
VGATERGDRGQVATGGDDFTHADPLVGARDVARVFARREQLAEDLLEDAEVVHLVARDGGERLVEHLHALA